MTRLQYAEVTGLFGYMNHQLAFRKDEPTIITAPNGAGKTHLLMLIRAALKLDITRLRQLPFSQLQVQSDTNRRLAINREINAEARTLTFQIFENSSALCAPVKIRETDKSEPDSRLPSHISELADGRWYDHHLERFVSTEFLERRYGMDLAETGARRFRNTPAIVEFVRGLNAILIDTKRLDLYHTIPRNSSDPLNDRRPTRTVGFDTNARSPILQYISQIKSQVNEARRNSVQATQRADVSFAPRALEAAKTKVDVANLRTRYAEVVEKYDDLAKNGLAVGAAPIDFPNKTTPTVRTILNVFLDDWEERLEPLLPVNEKLATLRSILDIKLRKSGKKTTMSTDGALRFETLTGEQRISVNSLSSGEQHLVALFTLLLFVATEGSVVLIDEPEISMHAAWKHAFLDDVRTVAKLTNLQIIMATHSTSIINGCWDLTEELNFTTIPILDQQTEGDDEESPEVDDLD